MDEQATPELKKPEVFLNRPHLEAYKSGLRSLGQYKEEFNEKRKLFEEENKELIDRISELNKDLGEKKDAFKALALDLYEQTKKKNFIGGLGIRVSKQLEYDEIDAMTWATENMKVALRTVLDKKMFDKYAKDNVLAFVRINERITATFPKEIKFNE